MSRLPTPSRAASAGDAPRLAQGLSRTPLKGEYAQRDWQLP
jgi:hypothetical protein